jgi:hypothetical protein
MSAPVASDIRRPFSASREISACCSGEPSRGHEHDAKLVAVQGGGVRLVVQPGSADVSGRGVLEEFFFDCVAVEPGDGAQPPGDGGAGAASCLQVAGEAFDVRAADREQGQRVIPAPGGELAQVQGVGFAGQPAVPGQEACQSQAFGIGKCWLDGNENGGSSGGGHRVPPGPG